MGNLIEALEPEGETKGLEIVEITYTDVLREDRRVVETAENFRKRAWKQAELADESVDVLANQFQEALLKGQADCDAVVTVHQTNYTNARYAMFQVEAEAAGLDVEDYHGRGYYHGPAVRADSLDEVAEYFTVSVRTDSMGYGVIVYPR